MSDYRSSRNGYSDRDRYDRRDERSSRDQRDSRDQRGSRGYRDRTRSRSPKRERERERDRGHEREREPERGVESAKPRERERERDDYRDRPKDRRDYTQPSQERGSPSHQNGRDQKDERYERPLDRRAIEEGRRRREEERAKGVVYEEEPPKSKPIPTGPRRGVIAPREAPLPGSEVGSASPYPEVKREREDGSGTPQRGVEGGEGGGEEEEEEEEDGIAAMMGFGGFGTTKNKDTGQGIDGGVNIHKQRTWRQYMNRRGGFNRPLEKMK